MVDPRPPPGSTPTTFKWTCGVFDPVVVDLGGFIFPYILALFGVELEL